jgi:hypothetical protein
MAIKSKGRPRGGKGVAAAPRRPLVVRKPPIWRRPWLWITVGSIVLVAVLALVVISVRHNGRQGRTDREAAAVQLLFTKVRQRLPRDIQPIPPDALAIFPQVQRDVPSFGTDIKGDDLKKRGDAIAADALASSTALDGLDIQGLIPAEFGRDRQTLIDARFLISQGIAMYQEIGGLIGSTAGLSQEKAQAVLDQAQTLMNRAGSLFDQGYLKLTGVAKALGINTDSRFNPAPTLPTSPAPTASASTSPEPSASASGSASPEPSASASASGSPSAEPTASASESASAAPTASASG